VVESRLFSARFSQAQRLLQIEIAATPELAWLVDSRETDSSHSGMTPIICYHHLTFPRPFAYELCAGG
jgi:hypothetical protein